jgi:DNA gyrase inhibitor GyrI
MIFLLQEWLIVVCVCVYEQRMKNFDMLRSTNVIGGLYACTRHPVLLMGK